MASGNSIKSLPAHQRPREKMAAMGVNNLSNAELLAILLRTGSSGGSTAKQTQFSKNAVEQATELLQKYDLRRLLELNLQELAAVPGVKTVKACTILAAVELVKRALEAEPEILPLITETKHAVAMLHEMRDYKKEYFIVLYLNAKNQLIHKETISVGILDATLVHPREVFEPAIRYLAGSVILAHNHPSGNFEPSEADFAVTNQMIAAGKMMGIQVLDHVIMSKKGYFSFLESGLVANFE